MRHELKIRQCLLIHILEGKKTFESRLNDRDFQVGDTIRFLPIEDDNYDAYKVMSPIPDFTITYTSTYGMESSYICLALKQNS